MGIRGPEKRTKLTECLTKEQTQEMVVKFCRYLRKYWQDFSLEDWRKTKIIMQKAVDGWQLQALFAPTPQQLRAEKPVVVFEQPWHLIAKDGDDATVLMGMIMYSRIMGYFAKVKASARRSSETRRRIGRESMAKRWANHTKASDKQ